MERFLPEATDLAEVANHLRVTLGVSVAGPVVGRTRLRDEVVRHLGCSLLEGEQVVDTMVGRGFIKREVTSDGTEWWMLRLS